MLIDMFYQKFDLKLDEFRKLCGEQGTEFLAGARKAMLDGLLEIGYYVLVSNTGGTTIPHSVIVGAKPGMHVKTDFAGLVGKLQLPYKSGDMYTGAKPKEKAKNL